MSRRAPSRHQVLDLIQPGVTVTTSFVVAETGSSYAGAQRTLQQLVARGQIERVTERGASGVVAQWRRRAPAPVTRAPPRRHAS